MDGSGFDEVLETDYGENTVFHMMKGKAIQRAFGGHLMVDQCLTRQVISTKTKEDSEFHKNMRELEGFYLKVKSNEQTLETAIRSECINNRFITVDFGAKKALTRLLNNFVSLFVKLITGLGDDVKIAGA